MEIYSVKNLTFSYPEQEAILKSLNLAIYQGEFTVIFGESGSGKTTLLKLLKKELAPTGQKSGNVYYKDKEINELDNRLSASEIGFVMQNPEIQIVTDKVWHELAFGLENLGVSPSVIRSRVGEVANYFGIHNWFKKDTADLSGGQKQLLNLASVMALQPEVLILDEPTSQLDPIAASNFIQTLKKMNDDLGITIIMVEHELEEVLPVADKVIFLENGEILLKSTPEEIGNELTGLYNNHPMLLALPTALQIAQRMEKYDVNPLTIKEGRDFLRRNYQHGVKQLEDVKQSDSSEIVFLLKNVSFRYEKNEKDILENINMTFLKGEIFSILGGNGSGKSTFLHVLARQLRPYQGKIILYGKNIKKYSKQDLYENNIGLLPQNPETVFVKETIRKDYEELLYAHKYNQSEVEALIKKIAAKLNITHLLDYHPYDVSGGEQQKAALGKILLLDPNILLLDEPTKGIDAFAKQTLYKILKNLQVDGLTIILVSHDIEFTAQIADRVGLYFDQNLISVNHPTTFFTNNNFYTTAANRMTRNIFDNVITTENAIKLCQLNKESVHEKSVN